ncbi:hypothetical protein Tco_0181890, partial [Tanacetum coccineum]
MLLRKKMRKELDKLAQKRLKEVPKNKATSTTLFNSGSGPTALKKRHVVLPDSEDEDANNYSKQGRNLQKEGLDEMVRNIMKDKLEVFKTPTQGKTLGEADISPKGLEAAETLAKVFIYKTKTYTRKIKTGLRRKLDANEVSTGEVEVNTGREEV